MAVPVLFRVRVGANDARVARKVLPGLFRRSVTVAVAAATAGLGLAAFTPPASAAVSHPPPAWASEALRGNVMLTGQVPGP